MRPVIRVKESGILFKLINFLVFFICQFEVIAFEILIQSFDLRGFGDYDMSTVFVMPVENNLCG